MSIMHITLLVGVLNFVAIALGLHAFSQRKVNLERRLKGEGILVESGGLFQGMKRLEEMVRPIGEMIVRSPEEMSRQEKKLVQAGFRRKDSVPLFYAAQLGIAVLLVLVFLVSGYLYAHPVLSALLSLL